MLNGTAPEKFYLAKAQSYKWLRNFPNFASLRLCGSDVSPLSPPEFLAQNFVIAARRQLDERNRQAEVSGLHFITVVEPRSLLSVGNENHRVAKGAQRHMDGRVVRHHDGPVGQRVGTDRRDYDRAQGGFEDGPAAGQAIG